MPKRPVTFDRKESAMKRTLIVTSISLILVFFVSAAPYAWADDHQMEQYNRSAAKTNAPLLSHFSLCKKLANKKKMEGPVDETVRFSTKDKQFYFYTRWKNVHGRHQLKVAIYNPHGNLFDIRKFDFKDQGPSWSVARQYYISSAPASHTPGKWRCNIFMDDTLAASKVFSIGDPDKQHPISTVTQQTPAIGVVRFEYNRSDGSPKKEKFAKRLSEHISQRLVADFPAYRIILPWQIHQDFEITSQMNLDSGVDGVIQSPLLQNVIKSHNIKALVVGSMDLQVLDLLDKSNPEDYLNHHIYLIDIEQKRLIKKVFAPFLIYRRNYKDSKSGTIIDASNEVYKQFIKKCRADIEQVMASAP